jgi:hypothetical protein
VAVGDAVFQVFQVFQTHVSSVLFGCYICCNSYIRILQVYVSSVSSSVAKVDLNVAYACMLQAYISSVSGVCCKCFIWMLHMFAMDFKHF